MTKPTTCEATFLPGDPPRAGLVALWGAAPPDDAPTGRWSDVQLVLPAAKGSGVRRRQMQAVQLALSDAVPWLVALEVDERLQPSLAAWSAAAKFAAGLVARGRLVPAVSAGGFDAWTAGPLDPPHHRYLEELADALPPEAHCQPIPGSKMLRLTSPGVVVRQFVDCVTDVLARATTTAALAPSLPFASLEPIAVE